MTLPSPAPFLEDLRTRHAVEDIHRAIKDLENVDTDFAIAAGTSFPGSPANGDVYVYDADTTNGVKWMFQYRTASASAYKWEFIGGAPLFAEVVTAETTTSTTYADLATAGPTITLPLAGDFDVEIGAITSVDGAGRHAYMSYAIGATAAVDADAIIEETAAANREHAASRPRRKTGLTAVALTAKYKTTATDTALFQNRWMRVWPVRT